MHIKLIMPIIYTPIVGAAVKNFSREFRSPRGLYLAYPDRDKISQILDNRTNVDIDIIVASDAEAILGIGDQGVGGMDIPIAKLTVYSLCAGIHPGKTLPILLDVGTNNQKLLDDPLYLGWRHPRITGVQYDQFIEQFVTTVKQKFSKVFLHWEDFGRSNAHRILKKYQNYICSFNDDIQGTGAVSVAAILAGIKANRQSLLDQRIIIFGAGTAGVGIANALVKAMQRHGASTEQAREKFWLFDRPGLLVEDMADLVDFQVPYARKRDEVVNYPCREPNHINLLDAIDFIKPTILIGCSAVSGAFSEQVVHNMLKHVARPIILPLSNPTERSEATPQDLWDWTAGQGLLATGSPFPPIKADDRLIPVAQSNNALIFPGLGLGVVTAQASTLTDNMIWAACETLSSFAPVLQRANGALLPDLDDARKISRSIGLAVARQAIVDQVATVDPQIDIEHQLDNTIWEPDYLPIYPM